MLTMTSHYSQFFPLLLCVGTFVWNGYWYRWQEISHQGNKARRAGWESVDENRQGLNQDGNKAGSQIREGAGGESVVKRQASSEQTQQIRLSGFQLNTL